MPKSKRLKTGLARGSGGPRGLVHIGVVKILEEDNVSLSMVAANFKPVQSKPLSPISKNASRDPR